MLPICHRLVRPIIHLLFPLLIFVVGAQSVKAQVGDGVVGWSSLLGNKGSAEEACRANYDWSQTAVGGGSVFIRYIGVEPGSETATSAGCLWTYSGYLCFEEGGGAFSCTFPAPVGTTFSCASGYVVAGNSRCLPANESTPASGPGCPDNRNDGGTASPATPRPISILDGAKLLDATDYRTDDPRFAIRRFYRSIPQKIDSFANYRNALGLTGGWRFDFSMELHVGDGATPVDGVTVLQPNGATLEFKRSGSTFTAWSQAPEVDYKLSLSTTPPANWSTLKDSMSEWVVRDADDRKWTLRTVPNINETPNKYLIALPIEMKNRDGYKWTFTYDASNNLQSITDSFGRTFGFTWNYFYLTTASGVPNTTPIPEGVKEIALPGGGKLRYTYDPAPATSAPSSAHIARLIKVEQLNSSSVVIDSVSYSYTDAIHKDFLTGVTDARGIQNLTVAYNTAGRAISSELAGGVEKYTVAYNVPSPTNTNVRTVTNPLGKAAVYTWNRDVGSGKRDNLRLVSVNGLASTNCPASASTLTYTNGLITGLTDEEGRVTAYVRNTSGRRTSITRGSGTLQASTTTIAWNATLNVPDSIVEPGLTTTYSWNTTTGRLTSMTKTDTTTHTVPYSTNGQTRTWAYTYDTNGLLLSVDGPLSGAGDTVAYTYNASGYPQTFTDEMGKVTTVTAWNSRGQPTSVTDANGVVTALGYDARGWLTSTSVDTAGTPATTVIAYNAVGDVESVTDPSNVVMTMAYDNARRLTTITNTIAETVNYVRNLANNPTSVTIKRADTTTAFQKTQTFDELGRIIKSVGVVPSNSQYQFGYDKTSNLTAVTDPRSGVFGYGFDALNRLISETDEASATVTLTRNGKDEITTYQDPRSLATTYVRNGFGEVIQEASPDKGTTIYVRDARGLVTQRTDPRGIVTNFTYDNAGRLTAKAYPASGGSYYVAYTWDVSAVDNKGFGRLTGISDESGVTWRPYDAKGRITVDYRTNYPAPALATQYAYDAAGKVTSMTYPSGRIVDFTRDSLGNISNMYTRKNAAAAQETVVYNVTRHPFGPLKGFIFGVTNIVAAFGLDTDYRISSLQEGGTANRTYAWTGTNLDQIANVLTPAQSETFTYAPTNRLATAAGGYGAYGWTYDSVGNRMSQTIGGVTSTYAYPSTSNRLISITPSGGSARNFGYDAAGATTTDSRSPTPAMTFTYDPEGRLSQATQTATPAENATYKYDAMSRLARRTINHTSGSPTVIGYVHDLDDHIIAETDSSGATLREYIWMDDLPVAVVDNVNTASPIVYRVHTDHLMRPIRITTNGGVWVWSAEYTPFGAVQALYPTATTMDLRFPGQWFQLENGLHYNWHRHYDASTGRYVQADPLGLDAMLRDGSSVYGYAGQSPMAKIDPSGQIVPLLVGIVVGVAIDYGVAYAKQQLCGCKDGSSGIGLGGYAALGAAEGTFGPFGTKGRVGIAGGGPSGTRTSLFSRGVGAAYGGGFIDLGIRNSLRNFGRLAGRANIALSAAALSYDIYTLYQCHN